MDAIKKANLKYTKKLKERKLARLSIDMDPKMHEELKVISARRNCPMRKLVLRALVAFIRYESKFN